MVRIVAVHGAATTARMWDRLRPLLIHHEFVAVERPRSGSLSEEVAWLSPRVEGSWVVGVSGGATLGLALASRVQLAGAVLHEPAVGRLAPDLLSAYAEAFEAGGTQAFGRALYGKGWESSSAPPGGDDVTRRELAMFRSFEPQRRAVGQARILVTVGASSPAIRHRASQALHGDLGYEVHTIPGAGHFVANDSPELLAALISERINAQAREPLQRHRSCRASEPALNRQPCGPRR
jgi:pimeloyl-ACP methyl ester carboxylesterase